VVAMALGVALLRPWRAGETALVVFLLALVVSWAQAWVPADELTSLRHLTGLGLGVLAMGVTSAWARTSARLMPAARIVVAGAITVLIIGWLGAAVNRDKLTGETGEEDASLGAPTASAPVISLRLPGLSLDGLVNSNALGGTALLVLPLCVGVYAAGRRATHMRQPTLMLAGTASALALIVVAISLSRSAWLAAGLTALVFMVRSDRYRRWLPWVLGAVLITAVLSVWVVRATAPDSAARASAAC